MKMPSSTRAKMHAARKAASLAGAMITLLSGCADSTTAPVAPLPTAFQLSSKDGAPLDQQQPNNGCSIVRSGALQFLGDGNGRQGRVILTHVLDTRGTLETVIDTASFRQYDEVLVLSFSSDGTQQGVAKFTILNATTLEIAGSACYPGENNALRDITKRLRYSRAG